MKLVHLRSFNPVCLFARRQLLSHKQTIWVWVFIGFLIRVTPPLRRSHVTIHGAYLPRSVSVTWTRHFDLSSVANPQSLTLNHNVNLSLTTFRSNMPFKIWLQFSGSWFFQWSKVALLGGGRGSGRKSTWCRRARATRLISLKSPIT